MRRLIKIIGGVLLGLLVLAGLTVGGALGYRAHIQHENRLALQIVSLRGIDEGSYVPIGGLRQWIQIRGEDKGNPVLLFVHGGPAMSMIPFTFRSMHPWEKSFTVVQWEQRGAGRTYILNGGADSTATGMNQIIDDGVQVTRYLRAHLDKPKIIVMGESWGSAIALEMVRARPELFYAYVGTGQAVDMRRAEGLSYRMLLERVRAQHDEAAIRQLVAIGPPPYASAASRMTEQQVLGEQMAKAESEKLMGRDLLFAPGYSLRELFESFAGATRHRSVLLHDDETYSVLARGSQFAVPLFFFQGTDDLVAPASLVSELSRQVKAPRSELVLFPGGGHNAFYFLSERFLQELDARVRPLAH
jgi:pimeloyl-ACP methyl ester carboxylesterase